MGARDQLVLDEASHTYTRGGVVVPGVTHILEPLCSWEHVPLDVLERKGELGRAVHLATYYDDKGTLDDSTVSPEVAPYLDAWRLFRQELKPKLLLREYMVYHDDHNFAGTLDVEMELGGELTIGDIKSGVKHRVHGVQIAAYALARKRELVGVSSYPRRVGIYLKPNGRYELAHYTRASDYPTFLSMLNLYNWRAHP